MPSYCTRPIRTSRTREYVYGRSAPGITRDVLGRIELELMELLDVRSDALEDALLAISSHVAPRSRTALDLLKEHKSIQKLSGSHLATQLAGLDRALRGGVPLGTITELVGPAGIGKTQLCLMLAVTATLATAPGAPEGSVVYMDTENKFSSHRLVQIARTRFPSQFSSDQEVQQLMSRILVITPQTTKELIDRLGALEGPIIEKRVRLLVVDSIAALVRSEFGRERLVERQELLGSCASTLKYLAESLRIAVVVTNQVTTRGGTLAGQLESAYDFQESHVEVLERQVEDDGSNLAAALGTKWAHCVNIRLVLEAQQGQRFLKIAKAPMAAVLSFPYEIGGGGLTIAGDEICGVGEGTMGIHNQGQLEGANCLIHSMD